MRLACLAYVVFLSLLLLSPNPARIIGVCEAYDTMVSTVPWQVSKSPQEALDELRRCSGTQFDSNVVEAFYRSVLGGTTKDESRAAA